MAAAGVAALGLAGLLTTGAAAQAAPAAGGSAYVALGDSYAAGYGLPVTGAPAWCGQSDQGYPGQVAKDLGVDLTNATCAGATIADVANTSQAGGTPAVPPQIGALGSATKLVTLTIGGNDLGFSSIIGACVALGPTGPVVVNPVPADPAPANCKSEFTAGGVDALAAKIQTVIAVDLQNLFTQIRQQAPNALVVVVGYPALMPDAANTPSAGCYTSPLTANSFPFTDADVPYLAQTETTLNDTTQALARQAGFTFVPLQAATVAHTACATASPFINGITLDSSSQPVAGSMHPNLAGQTFMAQQVEDAIVTPVDLTVVTAAGTSLPGATFAYTGSDGVSHAVDPATSQARLLPGDYTVTATYRGTTQSQDLTITTPQPQGGVTLAFQTSTVAVQATMTDAAGSAAPVNAAVSYTAGGASWPVTDPAPQGTQGLSAQLLPGTYTFQAVYNGQTMTQQATVRQGAPGFPAVQQLTFAFTPAAVVPTTPGTGPSVNTGGSAAVQPPSAWGAGMIGAGLLGLIAVAAASVLARRRSPATASR